MGSRSLGEVTVRLEERFLGYILGELTIAQPGEGGAEGEVLVALDQG